MGPLQLYSLPLLLLAATLAIPDQCWSSQVWSVTRLQGGNWWIASPIVLFSSNRDCFIETLYKLNYVKQNKREWENIVHYIKKMHLSMSFLTSLAYAKHILAKIQE